MRTRMAVVYVNEGHRHVIEYDPNLTAIEVVQMIRSIGGRVLGFIRQRVK